MKKVHLTLISMHITFSYSLVFSTRVVCWLISRLFAINMRGSDSIELFKFVKKTFRIIGISAPQSNQKRISINFKNGLFLLCLVQLCIATVGYFFTEANSILAFGMVFFNATTTIETIILYVIFIWQIKNILNYFENCERFIQKSKYIVR